MVKARRNRWEDEKGRTFDEVTGVGLDEQRLRTRGYLFERANYGLSERTSK